MNIAVIPARMSSKRIVGKNIRLFHGLPMIAWSIKTALASRCFDHVIVSTDSKKTALIANRYGAETPFLRPASLSDDYTGTTAVVKHATQWLVDHHYKPDLICCIYATAPFVSIEALQLGQSVMQSEDCEFAFSVTEFPFPIQRALRLEQGRAKMFQPQFMLTRSQDLPQAYHDAGQFYWGKTAAWLQEKPIFAEHSIPVTLPRKRVVDIDTEEDWEMAELLFQTQLIDHNRFVA